MGYHSLYIYSYFFRFVCWPISLPPEKCERKSPAGIQLDFLLSAKWEITGLSFRNKRF